MNAPTEAYPLKWPEGFPRTPDHERERARFGQKANYGCGKSSLTIFVARKRLQHEIQAFTRVGQTYRIVPDMVVLSTNVPTRKDGLPYSNAREPDDPGVAVYLELDGEPHVFPCDKWDRVADNIAAIAAHLGAMRGIERWGVGDLHRVFAGFHALPPGTGESNGEDMWWVVLNVDSNATKAEVQSSYRRMRSQNHPDNGGDPSAFDRIQRAYKQASRNWR